MTLYAAGTAYGSGATSLGTATTNGEGNFTVQYTPPGTPTVLYFVALGGNAGDGTNSAIGLMGIAGLSNALPESVTINELTTVAAQWSLAQFIDSTGQVIGSPASNSVGFANALAQSIANLVDVAGTPAPFWTSQGVTEASCTGGSPPVNCDGLERLNTIGNILAACVQSSGPLSAACTTLLSETSSSTNTLQAARVIATNPVANVTMLYALQTDSSPFTPELGAAPDGFEIALSFDPSSSFDEPVFLALDAAGNVWVPNGAGDNVTELSFAGSLIGNFAPAAADFDGSDGVAIDASGNVWVTNFTGDTVSELLAGCSTSSCTGHNFDPSGANFDAPFNIAIDANGNAWITNRDGNTVTELTSSGALAGNFAPDAADFDFLQGVAIDATGNVWIGNTGEGTVVELNSSGGLVGAFNPAGAEFDEPAHVAFDASGNAWVTNIEGDTVSELLAGCTTESCTGLNFDPDGANFDTPAFVAMDAAGNAWVANEDGDSVTELNSSGALVGNFTPPGADYDVPDGLATDASGNVWVANVESNTVAELIGLARPVLTPQVACLKKTPAHAVCLP